MSFGKSIKKALKSARKVNPKYIVAKKLWDSTRNLRHKYGLTRSKLLPSPSASQGYNATGSDIYGPTGSIASKFAVHY